MRPRPFVAPRVAGRLLGNTPDTVSPTLGCHPPPTGLVQKEVPMLKTPMLKRGERAPALVRTSYDGREVDLGAPGRRTVLWFSPKLGLVDEYGDRLSTRWSP